MPGAAIFPKNKEPGEEKEKKKSGGGRRPNLDDTGDVEFGGVQSETGIDSTEEQDGEDIGKISNESPDLEPPAPSPPGTRGSSARLFGQRSSAAPGAPQDSLGVPRKEGIPGILGWL